MELAEKQLNYSLAEEKIYQVALSMIPYVGGTIGRQLISYCGSAREVFHTRQHLLQRIPGVGNKIIQSIRHSDVVERAFREVEACYQHDIHILTYTEDQYPFRLKQLCDAPIVIYYKGTVNLDHPKVLSIVGTRKATIYGKKVVEELMEALSDSHVLIVSGLAYGIDISAHRSALAHGLPTLGVMASGVDIIYPSVHQKEAKAMVQQGGLLTEHPLGCAPDARKFPARNRLIAGLADATIVVEAAEKGGALITANLANDYDREVFAVPGNLHQPYSRGCNALIRQHKAHILTSAKDLLTMMQWEQPKHERSRQEAAVVQPLDLPELDEQEKAVLRQLARHLEGMMIDELSWQAQIPVYQIATVLLQLEFKGLVRVYPGKKYKITTDQFNVL